MLSTMTTNMSAAIVHTKGNGYTLSANLEVDCSTAGFRLLGGIADRWGCPFPLLQFVALVVITISCVSRHPCPDSTMVN